MSQEKITRRQKNIARLLSEKRHNLSSKRTSERKRKSKQK
jgi:hypothetical protein